MTEPTLTWPGQGPKPAESEEAVNQRIDALLLDQAAAWQRRERIPVEVYLREQPALAAQPEGILDLIYHEVVLREALGETPVLQEYLRRFPHLSRELQTQFDFDGALQKSANGAQAPNSGPSTGDPGPTSASTSDADQSMQVPGYEILEELGRGGMGVVYKARQPQLNRLVALKMIRQGDCASAEELRRFRAEAEAVASLQHDNIVQVHAIGEHNGLPYFALEYCAGGSLQQHLAGQPQHPAVAARLLETLARATQAAHDNHLIHRDLKPQNVLLTATKVPKITDFGLAKRLDAPGPSGTKSGTIVGTPSYMAPEQASGHGKNAGPACDIYALGAILYDCLTGRPPFKSVTALDTAMQVIHHEPVPPAQLNPKVPRDLETICLKCLRKDPAQRYATALELAEDLRRFQAGEPIQAQPVGWWERLAKWARRRPALAALSGGLLAAPLALIVALVLAVLFTSDALEQARQAERTAAAAAQQARADLEQARKPYAAEDLRTAELLVELGGNFLRQKKYAAAEPLLLQGFEGMKHQAAAKVRLVESAQLLVDLYEAWGRPEQAALWRKTVAAEQAQQP
jgi:eukaryotic-like serine/threonine-protein kinase